MIGAARRVEARAGGGVVMGVLVELLRSCVDGAYIRYI